MSTEQEHAYFLRGLDAGQIERVQKRLPDTHSFRSAALDYNAIAIEMKCGPGSGRETLPAAGVCLQDVSVTLMEGRYGLEQALVSLEFWANAPGYEQLRVAQAQYYAADVSHRIYAAGEHLSAAITNMLMIPPAALAKAKQTSRQIKVLNYLKENYPTHPVTLAVLPLGASAEFMRTRGYRDDWVHDQPQRVAGLGITYSREPERWSSLRNADGKVIGHSLSVGRGDPASGSIEAIVDDANAAVQAMTAAARGVMEAYDAILATCGIRVDHIEGKLHVGLFDGH